MYDELSGLGLHQVHAERPEMEYLNISLTKDSSLLLHAVRSSFYWRIFTENHTQSSAFEIHKKSSK
jgi:hypothetical protein